MIKITDLSYSFGTKEILHNLNFTIEEGGFYAILGANGCGKTTLLRCIANMLTPQMGSVAIGMPGSSIYRDVRSLSARELAQQVSLVRQQVQTEIEFSAFEMVLMGRNPYQYHLQNESQADWDIVEQCMKQTKTWALRFAFPGEMSGGELQRVMIARALAQQTPIMLLDEPTSNLDISHQFEVMELLRSINQQERKTILIVVHDLNLALKYCPQALLLNHAQVLCQGSIEEVLTSQNIQTVYGVHASFQEGQLRLEHL